VTWLAPTNAGTHTPIQYHVEFNPGGLGCYTTQLHCNVSGLGSGRQYLVGVYAASAVGRGPTATTVTPQIASPAPDSTGTAEVLKSPSGLAAAPVSDGASKISWSETPSSETPHELQIFHVVVNPGGFSCTVVVSYCSIGGLSSKNVYLVSLQSTNSRGASAVVTTVLNPAPPTPSDAAQFHGLLPRDESSKAAPKLSLNVVGQLSIIAGNRASGAVTPGPATSSPLGNPAGVAVDSSGNLYVADRWASLVEKIAPDGTLSIIAGNASVGAPTPGPATDSALGSPNGVAVDSSGNVYIADDYNNEILKVSPDGTLSILAGTGSDGPPTEGPASSSLLSSPHGVGVDSSGNVYVADSGNNRIEKISPDGTLSVFAGNSGWGAPSPGPATSSTFYSPMSVAVDSSGNVYVADWFNAMIEKITPDGVLSIFAGNGTSSTPTVGPASDSSVGAPFGVAVDASGNVYVADAANYVIEKITADGMLSVFAGTGSWDYSIAGPAPSSPLRSPTGVAVDASGNVYIADSRNSNVEKVTLGVGKNWTESYSVSANVLGAGVVSYYIDGSSSSATACSVDDSGTVSASSDGTCYVYATVT